jgi:hypothetical protein
VKGLAFEDAAASIGVHGGAIAFGADWRPARVRSPHLAEYLMRHLLCRLTKIDQRKAPRRRGHEKMLRHRRTPGKWPWLLYSIAKLTSILTD